MFYRYHAWRVYIIYYSIYLIHYYEYEIMHEKKKLKHEMLGGKSCNQRASKKIKINKRMLRHTYIFTEY